MTAWIDEDNVLHIQSETVYEALALRWWLAKNEITNVNDVDLIPTRHLLFHNTTKSSSHGDSEPSQSSQNGREP